MQSLRERQAEQLENGTRMIEVLPKVPAVLLVGASRRALRSSRAVDDAGTAAGA